MYWCDNCREFHENTATVEEEHGERWAVCGCCGSEDIEPANHCHCGEPKKEADGYCEWCEATIRVEILAMIRRYMEITGKRRADAVDELISRLEGEI